MGVSISEFRGEYYFLSNFYSAPVTYNGMCFENNEAAFQAAKCPERMTEFCRLNPSEAKRLGRRVKLRGDWEEVKDTVMYEICKAKFSQNPDLADKLVATKDAELIEGNTWGDRIWGVCDGTLSKICCGKNVASIGMTSPLIVSVVLLATKQKLKRPLLFSTIKTTPKWLRSLETVGLSTESLPFSHKKEGTLKNGYDTG